MISKELAASAPAPSVYRNQRDAVILLDMILEPGEERRRLEEVYAEKYDQELLDLTADAKDLTEIAQQVLRDEMRKRGLSLAAEEKPQFGRSDSDPPAAVHFEQQRRRFDALPDFGGDGIARDFTWKTELCTCETQEQAWQLCETLRRARIDSWITTPSGGLIRVSVAADQLEQAQAIAAQPIPQEIVEESKADSDVPVYETPKCPACGAEDPVLESADPVNQWHCDECGKDWADPEAAQAGAPN